jgi:23S rRNA (adenine2030-N6)-methyltransferase
MNYRHTFHAGNFADCMKHALLVWLLRALQRKPAPVFVLDTHAGAGVYDLSGEDARRTREADGGILRLLTDPPPPLGDYLALVRQCRTASADPTEANLYPGSPWLIRALLRPGDRLACCEAHPDAHAALKRRFARDPMVAVHQRDGWEALRALLPPALKRGLVLIDPPFEAPDEFDSLALGLAAGHARFPTGVFAAWYPIKRLSTVRDFHARMRASGISDTVAAELTLRDPLDPTRLNGCGLLVINPPYRFADEVPALLHALLDRLSAETGRGAGVLRLTDE